MNANLIKHQNYQLVHDDCFNHMYYMKDNSVDSIITDPPYGILKHKIETGVDITRFFQECYRILKPNGFLVFFGQQPTLTTWNAEAFKHFIYKNEVIWYKRTAGSPFLDMRRLYENITIVCKGKRRFNDVKRDYTDVKFSLAEFVEKSTFEKDNANIKQFLKDKELLIQLIESINGKPNYCQKRTDNKQKASMNSLHLEEKKIIKIGKTIVSGFKPQNIVSFKPHNKLKFDMSGKGGGSHNIKHPTVKPVELMEYLINLTTNEGEVILDPFVGSGTTIIAGLKNNMKVIGIECQPQYHLIAQQRINEFMSGECQQSITGFC